ncbi:MAG: thioesterase family protein [Syntrophobacteraceae bacterium]
MRKGLEDFPVIIDVAVAWGEMDSFKHVNNTVYFRWFESSRIAYFRRIGLWELREATGIGPILSSAQCRFRIPLTFPDTVSIGARVKEIGEDRLIMECRVVSHSYSRVAAEGNSVIVIYNYNSQRKASVPAEVKKSILDLERRSDGGMQEV